MADHHHTPAERKKIKQKAKSNPKNTHKTSMGQTTAVPIGTLRSGPL